MGQQIAALRGDEMHFCAVIVEWEPWISAGSNLQLPEPGLPFYTDDLGY
jgi:hypothetical protein